MLHRTHSPQVQVAINAYWFQAPREISRPSSPSTDPLEAYLHSFGALPAWFDEIEPNLHKPLARAALRRGTPLTVDDCLAY